MNNKSKIQILRRPANDGIQITVIKPTRQDWEAFKQDAAHYSAELQAKVKGLTRRARQRRPRVSAVSGQWSETKSLCGSSPLDPRVAEDGVQIHGGYGFVKDYPAEKYFRDVKLTTIGEGTSEIQRMVIARELLKA